MANKKRRLNDLWVVGKEVEVEDQEGGESIVVWMQKMNPNEVDDAGRRAGAARARFLMKRNDRDSEEWQALYSEVVGLGTEACIETLIIDDIARAQQSAEAELAHADEWIKDNYLQGLTDSWRDELMEVFVGGKEDDPRYEEAVQCQREISRFDTAVRELVEGERERFIRDYEGVPEEQVFEEAVAKMFSYRGDDAWIREYRKWQVFYGTRELTDHKERYFSSREEVDTLAQPVTTKLINEYDALNVESSEGKDLPPTQDSWESSELLDGEETAATSGLAAANQ